MTKPPDVAAREYRQRLFEISEQARKTREKYSAHAKAFEKIVAETKARATAREIEQDKKRSKAERF